MLHPPRCPGERPNSPPRCGKRGGLECVPPEALCPWARPSDGPEGDGDESADCLGESLPDLVLMGLLPALSGWTRPSDTIFFGDCPCPYPRP